MPPDVAARICGGLWARGIFTDTQYEREMRRIDNRKFDAMQARDEKFRKIMLETREFYKKGGTK